MTEGRISESEAPGAVATRSRMSNALAGVVALVFVLGPLAVSMVSKRSVVP